jgi:transposase
MPPLLPASSFVIRRMVLDHTGITLEAEATTTSASCPGCGTVSQQIHDRYDRHPADLPWRGCPVRLLLHVRRFRCSNPQCARRTFAESFAPALPRRFQRTADAHALLLQVAWMMGGEAGARLAHAAGLSISADTLLRLLRRAQHDEVETPHVLGVDDLALRRGQRYATILVNLETSEPIDLLAGRDAETLAKWLREHPGVEVIVRDRSEAYAEGARAGAPDAVQVADRFHLVKNASAAMDELLQGHRRQIAVEIPEPPPPLPTAPAAKPLSPTKQRMAARRAARKARWEEVQRRHREGEGLRHIAREMGISRVTVRRLIDTPIPPRNRTVHPRPGGLSSPSLQPYVSYLQDRWQQGCHNITQLFREIGEKGYSGSRSLLYTALHGWREPRPPPKERQRRKSRRFSVRWLCLRPPDQLNSDESLVLQQVLEDARLATGYDLLQRFRALIAERDVAALDTWLRDAQESNLAPFVSMANGITNDRAAVEAALTMPWSTSMVEGHIHRVKLIKRQGYGRSSLALLRRRILAA